MYTQLKSYSQRLAFLMLIVGSILFIAQAPITSARALPGSPLRLRLRLESNTLRSGQTTKVIAEFLDRDYQQVPNDGTRVIEFGIASPGSKQTGSGGVSPQHITVRPGEWSATVTFVSGRPGKLFITASSEGLDSSQALVLIIGQQQSSVLSQLFETVAYAQSQNEIQILPREFPSAPANNKFHVPLQVSFSQVPPPGTIVRIATDPSAGIVYKKESAEGVMEIKLDEGQAVSDLIGIFSAAPGKIKVSVTVRPDGSKDFVEIKFDPPQPARIIFDSDPQSIGSNERAVPISIQLADEGGFPLAVASDRDRKISVSSAMDSGDFDSETLVLMQGRMCAASVLHLKRSPAAPEMKLLAVDEQDTSIKPGQKTITIQSPVVVAASWLLLAAVFGGAVGGLARQLHKADRLDRIMPKWTGRYWDLGLTGRISGSIVSGLFLYWAIKFGLARIPLDFGTPTVAFFFGGIGGFAGLVVLDRLVECCFKLLRWSPSQRKRLVVAHQRVSPPSANVSTSMENPLV